MFAMYDDDGLNFRSTIDKLYQVKGLESARPVHNRTTKDSHNNDFKDQLSYEGKITQEAKNRYRQIANLDTMHEIYHVNEIMCSTLHIIEETLTINECFEMMQDHKIQQLLIKSDSQLHLKGMVTLQDILQELTNDLDHARRNFKKPVSDIATKQIITTDPISDIRRVAKVMCDFTLNAIPVVDDQDKAIGIVTRHDIIKAVANLPHLQIWA